MFSHAHYPHNLLHQTRGTAHRALPDEEITSNGKVFESERKMHTKVEALLDYLEVME